jgi:hypothetical protein
MLDEELWIYMDLNIKAYDPCSLISSLSYIKPSELVSLTWVYCICHYSSGAGRWPVGCLFSCSH